MHGKTTTKVERDYKAMSIEQMWPEVTPETREAEIDIRMRELAVIIPQLKKEWNDLQEEKDRMYFERRDSAKKQMDSYQEAVDQG